MMVAFFLDLAGQHRRYMRAGRGGVKFALA